MARHASRRWNVAHTRVADADPADEPGHRRNRLWVVGCLHRYVTVSDASLEGNARRAADMIGQLIVDVAMRVAPEWGVLGGRQHSSRAPYAHVGHDEVCLARGHGVQPGISKQAALFTHLGQRACVLGQAGRLPGGRLVAGVASQRDDPAAGCPAERGVVAIHRHDNARRSGAARRSPGRYPCHPW